MGLVWIVAQSSSSPDPLIGWFTTAGPVGILAAIVVAFLKGWIVSGSELKRVTAERDRALELVYRQAGLSSRALDTQLTRLELEREIVELREEAAKRHESQEAS